MIFFSLQERQHQSDSSDSGTESDDEHDEEDGMTEGNSFFLTFSSNKYLTFFNTKKIIIISKVFNPLIRSHMLIKEKSHASNFL